MNLPPFPSQSLAGSFPSFPVNYIAIPNLVDLPSYIYSVTTYYGNPFNYPYGSPPTIASWQIPYPNLLALPQFFYQIIVWVIGWAGAAFEWAANSTYLILMAGTTWIINTLTGEFNNLTSMANQTAQASGIAAPLILALFLGIITMIAIILAMIVINALKTVV